MEQTTPILKDFINPNKIVPRFGLKEGMHVADFGVGSGFFTVIMAKAVGEKGSVTALDVLEPALEIVRHKAELEGLENINFIRANLEAERGSKLEDNSQDFVLLANILFQSQQKDDIIKEALRVAKSGRNIVIIDWKKRVGGLGGPPEEFRTDPGGMKAIAENSGLKFVNEFDTGQYHFGLTFIKQ